MPFSLALDVLVAILLVITICYAMALNRKLSSFRREKKELEKLAGAFGEATERAGDSIGALKSTAADLQDRIDKAQALRDDLVFLIDRGASSADRLEETVREARKEGGFGPRSDSGSNKKKKKAKTEISDRKDDDVEGDETKLKSDAERELLKALQAAR